ERTHAHNLAIAAAAGGCGDANDLARGIGFAGWRQAVGLARDVGNTLDDAADGATQGAFHAFRHGGEICLSVESRKNGPAHEGRAAKTGENDAAEPLDRNAATVHQPAALAVDRQRRLVAEIDVHDPQPRPQRRVSLALLQARHPLRPRPRAVYGNTEVSTRPGRRALI